MCLAVPGKIVSVDNSNPEMKMAKVNFAGVEKDICIQWLPDIKVGDYVLAHVGVALNKIDEEEALETLRLFKELDNFNQADEIR
ncbi:MAG: HypC/HybG/HupF family hydrogenase formation chaperone [Bacteroidales bacterium]|nr:HypC/HybG/HupF family hydrogenase formation chaperone [Bacteroidales bacterium]